MPSPSGEHERAPTLDELMAETRRLLRSAQVEMARVEKGLTKLEDDGEQQ